MSVKLHDLRVDRQEHVHWYSDALGRGMDLEWYGHAGRTFLWFPSFGGRYYDLEGFGMVEAIQHLLDAGELRIVAVDSVDNDSFGADHLPPAERLSTHERYDRYLAEEVVPWIHDVTADDGPIGTVGMSFGAYHAVNFGFRHPDLVDKVVGLSGAYDIHDMLDGYWDLSAYYHCPVAYVSNMDDDWIGRLSELDISIVSGEDDYLAGAARDMIGVLEAKGIPHRGHVWGHPYGHDWGWWRRQVTHYVP
ncbi:MAG: alpha/beta hydrolase-fold protein [Nitriliruptorales bacterium]|nr:alpha/beta hydrolase-fold protein [Nitriliruptorales bacterium]